MGTRQGHEWFSHGNGFLTPCFYNQNHIVFLIVLITLPPDILSFCTSAILYPHMYIYEIQIPVTHK